MSEWDGKVVMSTPGGPVIEMSLGEYVACKDAEIERLRAEVERLREVLVAMHIAAAEDGEVWITLALPSSETTVAAHLGSKQRLTGAVALLFEQIRRNALEAKP